jgi:prepilin-type N-terminal cleavage/methylation domain-containing protein
MLKDKKGFTLIELLVVIAIIGILSSVVLASLNTARNKGTDAKTKTELGQIRAAAEIFYDTSGSKYGTAVPASATCPATANSLTADAGVVAALGAISGTKYCGVAADYSAYAVAAPLLSPSAAGGYWCIDSVGNAKEIIVTTPGNIAVTDDTCVKMDAK